MNSSFPHLLKAFKNIIVYTTIPNPTGGGGDCASLSDSLKLQNAPVNHCTWEPQPLRVRKQAQMSSMWSQVTPSTKAFPCIREECKVFHILLTLF